jgi:hypothetical protein
LVYSAASLLFVVAGFVMVLSREATTADVIAGTCGILFFGVGAADEEPPRKRRHVYKLTAVTLSRMPGVEVQTVAHALDSRDRLHGFTLAAAEDLAQLLRKLHPVLQRRAPALGDRLRFPHRL